MYKTHMALNRKKIVSLSHSENKRSYIPVCFNIKVKAITIMIDQRIYNNIMIS